MSFRPRFDRVQAEVSCSFLALRVLRERRESKGQLVHRSLSAWKKRCIASYCIWKYPLTVFELRTSPEVIGHSGCQTIRMDVASELILMKLVSYVELYQKKWSDKKVFFSTEYCNDDAYMICRSLSRLVDEQTLWFNFRKMATTINLYRRESLKELLQFQTT